jgi:hypothetical protein
MCCTQNKHIVTHTTTTTNKVSNPSLLTAKLILRSWTCAFFCFQLFRIGQCLSSAGAPPAPEVPEVVERPTPQAEQTHSNTWNQHMVTTHGSDTWTLHTIAHRTNTQLHMEPAHNSTQNKHTATHGINLSGCVLNLCVRSMC